jgi:hypothetical protein
MDIEDYKTLVDKYYLIGYKWTNEIEKIISIVNNKFMKLTNSIVKTLETIDVSVSYPHFKIVKLNFYLLHLDNSFSNYDSNNYKHNQIILDYVYNKINKDKINKISINIVENDKIFTINDDKFNIYTLDDVILVENKYYNFSKKIKIKTIISNFIEKC